MGVVRPRMLGRLATGIWQSASTMWWIWIRRFAEPHEYAGVTEAEARAALAAYDAIGGIEPWIAARPWQVTPGGWAVAGELQGWRFRVEPVPEGLRVTASSGKGSPATWIVSVRPERTQSG
jgi:hypothetical protein